MLNKIAPNLTVALEGVADRSTVLIGGFGVAVSNLCVIDALLEQGAADLTIVSNNARNAEVGMSKLVRRCTYPLTAVACVSRVYTDHAPLAVRKASSCSIVSASAWTRCGHHWPRYWGTRMTAALARLVDAISAERAEGALSPVLPVVAWNR